MKLKLEKRGADVRKDYAEIAPNMDVCSCRLTTPGKIDLKDGRKMFFEITLGNRTLWKTVHHRNGTTSSKKAGSIPVLCVDTDYERDDGMACRDLKIEKRIWDLNLDYTMENILFVINAYSREYYDEIEFV